MSMKALRLLACTGMIVLLCLPARTASGGDDPMRVFVSIVPQAYVVQRVGGELVEVGVLVGEGQDPHTFEPTPAQMARLARSDIYFTVGVSFESSLIPKIRSLFPDLWVAEMARGVRLRHFAQEQGESPHERGGQVPDPHTWLDPKRVKVMAANAAAALKEVDPQHGGRYEDNLRALLDDLDRLDAEITRILEPLRGRKIYVFHPSFGYFCESYRLEQVAIEVRGKEPSTRELARIIEGARREGVRTIFVQPQFSMKAGRIVAESIGGSVVPLNPLPRDYLKDLKEMADIIREAYHEE